MYRLHWTSLVKIGEFISLAVHGIGISKFDAKYNLEML